MSKNSISVMKNNQRDNSVTIAKAIAILLMVLAHSGSPIWILHIAAMSIIALFLFMSGYCFKPYYLQSSKRKSFILKRIKGLYWPYVKWGVVFVLLHNVFFSIGIYNDTSDFRGHVVHPYDTLETVKRLLSVMTMHGTERLLGAYWYLKAMFFGSLIFFATRLIIKKPWYGVLLLLIVTFITSYFNLKVPYLKIGSLDCFSAFWSCNEKHKMEGCFID